MGLAFIGWQFLYFAYSWAASGKTFGMAVFGIRVVRPDGTDASWRQALVRTLALPLGFLLSGSDFLGIILGDKRRALYDVIAGTTVVYSWDARAARLRFLPAADPLPIVLPCTVGPCGRRMRSGFAEPRHGARSRGIPRLRGSGHQ